MNASDTIGFLSTSLGTDLRPSSGESSKVQRMVAQSLKTNPCSGRVVWSPVKSLWFTAHSLVAVIGGWLTFGWDEVMISAMLTVFVLCAGHTVGLHRLLIHRSFTCPLWLEYALVHLGTVVGMGGPISMIYQHDIRDWGQRHTNCHPYLTDQASFWLDGFWQIHCRLELHHPPLFFLESRVAKLYSLMQRTWMLQQIPWALALYALGGIGWVVWGISVRVVVCLTGHWLIGWLAHRVGERTYYLVGHAVQGYNLPHLGLITMGEGWHNNHHAWPESAQLGHGAGQHDPGWWFIRFLVFCGLAKSVQTHTTLPQERPERQKILPTKKARASATFLL